MCPQTRFNVFKYTTANQCFDAWVRTFATFDSFPGLRCSEQQGAPASAFADAAVVPESHCPRPQARFNMHINTLSATGVRKSTFYLPRTSWPSWSDQLVRAHYTPLPTKCNASVAIPRVGTRQYSATKGTHWTARRLHMCTSNSLVDRTTR